MVRSLGCDQLAKRPLTDEEFKQILKKVRNEVGRAIEYDEKEPNKMSDEELGRWIRQLLHEFWPP